MLVITIQYIENHGSTSDRGIDIELILAGIDETISKYIIIIIRIIVCFMLF